MHMILTDQRFPLAEGEEGRLVEFSDDMTRAELNSRIASEDAEHPWTHATHDDLMQFVRNDQHKRMREQGLNYRLSHDDPEDHVVIAMGSTNENGPACHKMTRQGWNVAFNQNGGLWGGEGMFFLVKRPVQTVA